MVKFFFSLLCFSVGLQLRADDRSALLNRINANIVVQDYAEACLEAEKGISYFPDEKSLYEARIKASAYAGDEKRMWNAWMDYLKHFPESACDNNEIHETMAWGVLWKGAESPLPLIRLMALLGSFFSNDAKSVPLMKRFIRDRNAQIRSVAMQLVGMMRDACLCDEILSLYHTEKDRKVRPGIMKAIGKMKIHEGHPLLLAIVADTQAPAQEKAAATEGLLSLLERIDRQDIEKLANSNRASLRLLACEVVGHLRSNRDFDLMMIAATDNHRDVRVAALRALGLLDFPEDKEPLIRLARAKINDPSSEVAVTAAWLLTLADSRYGPEAFRPLLCHSQRDVRLHAAAAIAASGASGVSLAKESIKTSDDHFFKMNLAIGLIYQQTDTIAACRILEQGLIQESGRWMWKEEGPFRVLAPSKVRQDDDIPNAPEAIDQLTRIEILNMLAVMRYSGAENAIREFLRQHKWGIAGLASALLLMEGDEASLNLIQALLNDPDSRLRMQAALVLSLWGGKEEAIAQLEAGYASADRETKEKILEGLGKIGSRTSVPFLLEKLQDPGQSLRLIAAASLLQCLYH